MILQLIRNSRHQHEAAEAKKGQRETPERRGATRTWMVDYFLYYLKDPLRDSSAIRAEIDDISKKGIRFISHEKLPMAAELALKIQIPYRQDYIRATGIVTRSDKIADGLFETVVTYRKILNGPDDVLFESLITLLTETAVE